MDNKENQKGIDFELAERVVKFLNEAFERDPDAINTLMHTYVPCNEALFDQFGPSQSRSASNKISALGLLNGLCGHDETGQGGVAVQLNVMGEVMGFWVSR